MSINIVNRAFGACGQTQLIRSSRIFHLSLVKKDGAMFTLLSQSLETPKV